MPAGSLERTSKQLVTSERLEAPLKQSCTLVTHGIKLKGCMSPSVTGHQPCMESANRVQLRYLQFTWYKMQSASLSTAKT